MPTGEFEPGQVAVIMEVGQWLRKYGDTVYHTGGGPFKPGPWGVSTHTANIIYVHILDWRHAENGPNKSFLLPPINKKIVSARILSSGKGLKKVDFEQAESGIILNIAEQDRNQVDTIVRLKLSGLAREIKPIDVPGGK